MPVKKYPRLRQALTPRQRRASNNVVERAVAAQGVEARAAEGILSDVGNFVTGALSAIGRWPVISFQSPVSERRSARLAALAMRRTVPDDPESLVLPPEELA